MQTERVATADARNVESYPRFHRLVAILAHMPTHGAFLKGMNLGGRRITNDDLRAAIRELGFERVETFRASGNVVLQGARRSEETLREHIEAGLQRLLGYAVPTFIRNAEELRHLASAQPFAPDVLAGAGKLQVALLHEEPSTEARERVLALATADDRLALWTRELFWLPAGPMSESRLDWREVERALGPTTTRTKGTIEQLVSRHFAA